MRQQHFGRVVMIGSDRVGRGQAADAASFVTGQRNTVNGGHMVT